MQRQCRESAGNFRIVAGLMVAATLASNAGCRRPKPGPPPRPEPRWQGVNLRIACPDGPARRVFEQHGRTWARDNGAQIVLLAPDEKAADILVFPPPELASLVEAGRLRPLADASETAAFLPMYRSRLLHWDGRAFALPLLGDGYVFIYRSDLYSDSETKAAYRSKHNAELMPPTTWDDVERQAAFFAAHRNKSSWPPVSDSPLELDRLFGSIAAAMSIRAETGAQKSGAVRTPDRNAAFSFQYDVETGLPRVATEGFVESLKLLQSLQPHRASAPDGLSALRSDQAVLAIVSLQELYALKGTGPWGVIRPPGSRRVFASGASPDGFVNLAPYVGSGGALAGVASSTNNFDAAWDLLAELSGERISLEIVHDPTYGAGPFRDSHLSKQSAGWFAYGLDDANTTRLREVLREMADPRIDNPGLALRTPGQAAHRAALLAAIRGALMDKSDPSAALNEVSDRWRALDGDLARARAAFRKSIGLQ